MLKALVKKLARHGKYSTEINKKNHFGNTPLHLAFQFDHPEIVKLLVKGGAGMTIKNNAQMTPSELGAKLERGDSLDVLKQDESYGDGGSRRGGAHTDSQVSVTQSSRAFIPAQDVRLQGADIAMTALPVSLPSSHQPNPETHSLSSYDITASHEMSQSHIDDAIDSPRTPHSSNNTKCFNNDTAWSMNIPMTAERAEILAWLSPIEPRIRHQDIRTRRADNVGEWRMQAAEFQSWCDGAQQEGDGPATLFYCDHPAVGKTYFT